MHKEEMSVFTHKSVAILFTEWAELEKWSHNKQSK